MSHRTAGPYDAPGARFVTRSVPGRRYRQNAARPFDLNAAQRVARGADDAELMPPTRFHLCPAPFRSAARLSAAAATKQEPGSPVAGGRELVRTGPEWPAILQRGQFGRSEPIEQGATIGL